MNGMRLNNFVAAGVLAAAVAFGGAPLAKAEVTPETYGALVTAGVDTRDVKLIEVEGILIVRGRVPNRASIDQASSTLRSLGFARVANLLKVSGRPDDEQIRRNVERALVNSPSLDGCKFRINTQSGVVKLDGTVRDELQKDVATDIAREVEGVTEVVNALQDR